MIRVVVPVSGGKDSQAFLKLAASQYPPEEVLGLFCDTKFEHPWTYAHVDKLVGLYGIKIQTISAGSVPAKVRQYRQFPGGAARFCTGDLKIEPGRRFYTDLALRQRRGFEVWYGLRTGESSERAARYATRQWGELYAPHEYMPSKFPKYMEKLGVMIRLPIIDLSTEEIFGMLDGKENPLYRHGFDRVGCFPCLAGGDKAKIRAFEFDDFGRAQLALVRRLEEETGKSVFTSKIGQRFDEGPGCSICAM